MAQSGRCALAAVIRGAHQYRARCAEAIKRWRLASLRRRMFANRNRGGGVERCFGYAVRFTDSRDFYIQYKDEFVRRIYNFDSKCSDPLILDGGSNIGMSILAFKRSYPQARIIGFEPDPEIFEILQQNVDKNGLRDVRLINAGLGGQSGTAYFKPDHSSGGKLEQNGAPTGSIVVKMEQLSDYLNEPVDFLKLNIEGDGTVRAYGGRQRW